MYGEALEQDLLFRRDLEEAFATQDFDGCRVLLDSWKPKALSRKKDDSVQEDKRELAKNLRDQAKDAVKNCGRIIFMRQRRKCWKNWNFAGSRCRN